MNLLMAWALAAAVAPTVSLDAPQRNLLVGEPPKIHWQISTGQVLEVPAPEYSDRKLLVRGGDVREFMVVPYEREVMGAVTIRPEEPHAISETIMDGWYKTAAPDDVPHILFAKPGKYSVALELDLAGKLVRSNEIEFDVSMPTEEERAAWEQVRRNPTLLTGHDPGSSGLVRQFPRSRYVRWLRLQGYMVHESAIINAVDPDTGVSLRDANNPEGSWQDGKRHVRRFIEDLQSERDLGVFDEDRLYLISHWALRIGDEATAKAAADDLASTFGASPLARKAAKEAADLEKDKVQSDRIPRQ